MTLPCLSEYPDHVSLTLHVVPGAKRTEVLGLHGDALRVKLAAPPVDGKANQALQSWLAEQFGVPKGNVTLKLGQTSRRKVWVIQVAPHLAATVLSNWLHSEP